MRTCVGCRRRHPAHALTRCVHPGRVSNSSAGRGAWVCSVNCAESAGRSGGFARAWRRSTDARTLAELVETLRNTQVPNRVIGEESSSVATVAECEAGSPADDVRNQ